MRLRRRGGSALVAAVVAVPLLALLVRALADEWHAPALVPQRWGWRGISAAAADPGIAAAVATSALVAVLTASLALVLAWPAARLLGERRLRRPLPIFLILALPLLVPPYAVGFGLAEWYLRLGLAGSVAGLVLAHVALALPYAVLVLLSAFGPDLRRQEEMARTTGLSPVQRMRWVTLPGARAVVVTAGLLAFLVSWSQYGTSLAVSPSQPTLPLILLPYIGSDPQVAAALGLLFVAPAMAAVAITARPVRGRG